MCFFGNDKLSIMSIFDKRRINNVCGIVILLENICDYTVSFWVGTIFHEVPELVLTEGTEG